MPKPKKIITSGLILAGVANVVAPSLQTSAGLMSFLKKAGSSISSGVSVVFRVVGITALVSCIKEKFFGAEDTKNKKENNNLDAKSDSTSEGSGGEGNINIKESVQDLKLNLSKENSNEIENNEKEIIFENQGSENNVAKEKEKASFNWEERCMEIFNNPEKFKWRVENENGRDALYVDLDGKDSFYNISDIFLEGKRQLENKLKNMSYEEKAETVDIKERKVFDKWYLQMETKKDLLNKKISVFSFLGSAFSENPCSVIDVAVNNGNLNEYIYNFFEPLKNNVSRILNKGKKENDMEYFQRITETGTFQEDKDFFKELSEKLDRLFSFSSGISRKLKFNQVANFGEYSPEEFLSALVERAILEEEKNLSDGDRLDGMDCLDSATRKEIFNYVKTNHPDFCRKLIKEDENNKKMYLKYINPDVNEEEIPVNQKNIEKEEQEDDLEIDYHSLLLEGIEKCNWKMQKLDGKDCLFVREGKNGDFKLASSYFLNCKRKLEKELKEKSKEELNKKVKESGSGMGLSSGEETVEQKIKDDIDICNFMIFASVDNPWGVVYMESPSLIDFSTPFFRKFLNSDNEAIENFAQRVITEEKYYKAKKVRGWAITKIFKSTGKTPSTEEVIDKIVSRYAEEKTGKLLDVKNYINDKLECSTTEMYNDFLEFLKYHGSNKLLKEVQKINLRSAEAYANLILNDKQNQVKSKLNPNFKIFRPKKSNYKDDFYHYGNMKDNMSKI